MLSLLPTGQYTRQTFNKCILCHSMMEYAGFWRVLLQGRENADLCILGTSWGGIDVQFVINRLCVPNRRIITRVFWVQVLVEISGTIQLYFPQPELRLALTIAVVGLSRGFDRCLCPTAWTLAWAVLVGPFRYLPYLKVHNLDKLHKHSSSCQKLNNVLLSTLWSSILQRSLHRPNLQHPKLLDIPTLLYFTLPHLS